MLSSSTRLGLLSCIGYTRFSFRTSVPIFLKSSRFSFRESRSCPTFRRHLKTSRRILPLSNPSPTRREMPALYVGQIVYLRAYKLFGRGSNRPSRFMDDRRCLFMRCHCRTPLAVKTVLHIRGEFCSGQLSNLTTAIIPPPSHSLPVSSFSSLQVTPCLLLSQNLPVNGAIETSCRRAAATICPRPSPPCGRRSASRCRADRACRPQRSSRFPRSIRSHGYRCSWLTR